MMHIYQSDKNFMAKTTNKPRVAITMGDVSGIGPEVIYKAFLHNKLSQMATFVIIGDLDVIKNLTQYIKGNLKINVLKDKTYDSLKESINLIDLDNISSRDYKIGFPNKKTALAAKQYLDKAIALAKTGRIDCIVTGPIHKKTMSLTDFNSPGHTEYIADRCDTKDFAMMMVSKYFKVILVTTHIPLKDVPSTIKTDEILKKIKLAHISLVRYFGIRKPRLALCALNPHSGEEGVFGTEEKDILLPAVRLARKAHIDIAGPLASDSLFPKAYKGAYDALICLYHDQAMIPIKLFGPEDTVNLTLGLPFIRTSPAHGTGHDIAGFFRADEASMCSAIRLATKIYKNSLRGSF